MQLPNANAVLRFAKLMKLFYIYYVHLVNKTPAKRQEQ
jgi:hypothetical protein